MNDSTVTGASQDIGGNTEEQDTGGNDEDDIGEIFNAELAPPKQVIDLWNQGKTIKEISKLTGTPLKDVCRILKGVQVRFVREEGHSREK